MSSEDVFILFMYLFYYEDVYHSLHSMHDLNAYTDTTSWLPVKVGGPRGYKQQLCLDSMSFEYCDCLHRRRKSNDTSLHAAQPEQTLLGDVVPRQVNQAIIGLN